jgi:hypothetical protein
MDRAADQAVRTNSQRQKPFAVPPRSGNRFAPVLVVEDDLREERTEPLGEGGFHDGNPGCLPCLSFSEGWINSSRRDAAAPN